MARSQNTNLRISAAVSIGLSLALLIVAYASSSQLAFAILGSANFAAFIACGFYALHQPPSKDQHQKIADLMIFGMVLIIFGVTGNVGLWRLGL